MTTNNKRVPIGNLVHFHTAHPEALFDDGTGESVVWNPVIHVEVKEWLDENVEGKYKLEEHFFQFDDIEDAVAFKLRWT